jgi:hypothetical protein
VPRSPATWSSHIRSIASLTRLDDLSVTDDPSFGVRRGYDALSWEGALRTPVAGWLALIVMLGLFALIWSTGRPPCAPFGLWHTLQMNCR